MLWQLIANAGSEQEIANWFSDKPNFKDLVNDQDTAGNTALYYTVKQGKFELAIQLLAAGANPNSHCVSVRVWTGHSRQEL